MKNNFIRGCVCNPTRAVLLLLSCFAMVNVAMAAKPTTSVIPLVGGIVGPGKTLHVSVAPLLANAYYKVQCKIVNKNTNPVVLNFDVHGSIVHCSYIKFLLNGAQLHYKQGAVKAGTSSFTASPIIRAENVTPMGNIAFYNLDTKNSVEITDCIATPVTSM